jgi:methylenetetrahydrofolate dehydrogenase (NADP+)/methenyltetrahydrofolate cyclohydrolase
MPAVILETRVHANTLRDQLSLEVAKFKQKHNLTPGLVIVAIGEDTATYDYIKVVTRNAMRVGIKAYANLLPADISKEELIAHLQELSNRENIHAISLQTPLPKNISLTEAGNAINPLKDVEGLSPMNNGSSYMGTPVLLPPPALGGMKLLSLYNINPAKRHAVIVGRNLIIGKPMNLLLTEANATVTVCHSQTANLAYFTRQADILVVATQQAGLINAEMIKPGAVVVDFGINYINGKVTGDVDFERVKQIAGAVTPMPGGTGPLTVISLLNNVLKAATLQRSEVGNQESERLLQATEA